MIFFVNKPLIDKYNIMNMLFYFEFSCIQILLNIHMNELLFCKLISNTISICICSLARV